MGYGSYLLNGLRAFFFNQDAMQQLAKEEHGIWWAVLSVGILGVLSSLLYGAFFMLGNARAAAELIIYGVAASVENTIALLVALFVITGLLFGFAKLFGGTGKFTSHVGAYGILSVFIQIITTVLLVVGVFIASASGSGWDLLGYFFLVVFIVAIFSLAMQVFYASKVAHVVHGLSWGRAVGSVLLSALVLVLVVGALYALLFTLAMGSYAYL